MGDLATELRKKFATPQAAMRALGLSPSLIEPRLACDEDSGRLKHLMLALRADMKGTAQR